MTDASTTSTTDAVWAGDIALEFAASDGGDYLSQINAAQVILDTMVIAIRAGELLVFVQGVAGMVERPAREREPSFPVGDYRLRTATARKWIASHIDTQAALVAAVSASGDVEQPTDAERRLVRLRELGGNVTYKRCEWKITGMSALVASEKSEGRKRRSEKTIRADLKEGAQAERDAKAGGVFDGLGHR